MYHVVVKKFTFAINVKFEEINLKFGKVRKSSRYNKVRNSSKKLSRSACNQDAQYC